MTLRIKNWKDYQHFNDRSPPWIKLYRRLLDDVNWHELSGDSAKILVMLWLLASEDKTGAGVLPDIKTISFRLRLDIKTVSNEIIKLNHWVVGDDITMISERYQVDALETETQEKRREEKEEKTKAKNKFQFDADFEIWWKAYPHKVGKGAAREKYETARGKADAETLLSGVQRYIAGKRPDVNYCNPATWLHQERWQDELTAQKKSVCFL